MKKPMAIILTIMLMFLTVNVAPAESYLSPYELLGKFLESFVYIMDPEVTLTTAMVREDNEEKDYPLTITETIFCHGRFCEVTITGTMNSTTEVTLRALPAQLRMDEEAMFPGELRVYHDMYYVICSYFPVFTGIPDGYDIDTLIGRPGEAFFDEISYYDEEWTWISRKPMQISLAIRSKGTEYRFSAESQPDGTVLIRWTF